MDINDLVKDSIPSKENTSSEIAFESLDVKIRNIVLEVHPSALTRETPSNADNQDTSPASKWKNKKALALGGAGVLGVGGAGIYAALKRKENVQRAAANQIKTAQAVDPNLKQIKIAGNSSTSNQVADISKANLSGKTGDAAQNIGQAAGQWGQTIKSGMGGVADFASRNPHLALAASALGGVAALKKLRRR